MADVTVCMKRALDFRDLRRPRGVTERRFRASTWNGHDGFGFDMVADCMVAGAIRRGAAGA